MDQTGVSSIVFGPQVLCSHARSSRGVSWHQPTGRSASKAMSPGGGPWRMIDLNADLFFAAALRRYWAPMRQYMHQQLLQAPLGPKRFSMAGQRSGVAGRIVMGVVGFLVGGVWGMLISSGRSA